MDLESLKQAILGSANIQAPPSSLGASQAPELAQLYQADFQLPQSTQGYGALAQGTEDQLKAQAAAASGGGGGGGGGRKSAGGYTVKPRKDGGYGFYDPDGNEISANDYAQATGKDVASVLKGSQNPIDRQFAQDYKQLQQYMKDKSHSQNDPKARSRAQSVETQVRKLYGIKMHDQTIESVVNAFVQAYPTVFGGNQAGKQGTNSLFAGSGSKKTSSKSSGSKYSLGSSGR